MCEQQGDASPPEAEWTELSDEVLVASRAKWIDLCDRFEPYPRSPAEKMVATLRKGVRCGQMDSNTHVHHDGDLLGFYSIDHVSVAISDRAAPIASVAGAFGIGSEPSLLLSSIVRADNTGKGFGQVILEHAIGLALEQPEIRALCVEPANQRVAEMWRDDYAFKPAKSSAHPGLLYLPLDPARD
jgi:GNAT superfamily N-acetyltransferase